MQLMYGDFLIRDWCERDRLSTIHVVNTVMTEYNLKWEPESAERDLLSIETSYPQAGGQFWVVEYQHRIVGTAAYCQTNRSKNAVEICRMYLLPEVRGKGLGKFLLQALETTIISRQFSEIWIETATRLKTAINLYERNGYQLLNCAENSRCDRLYIKYL